MFVGGDILDMGTRKADKTMTAQHAGRRQAGTNNMIPPAPTFGDATHFDLPNVADVSRWNI